ncbi:MAG TPA: M28 family peptidase [Gaiellaceae bacterium]
MAAHPTRGRGTRARRGSLARPVNARMYRGTWLLVGLPLLVAAFSVGRASPLPAPAVPPTFDGTAAAALAEDLVGKYPERPPGAVGPAQWVDEKFALYGFRVRRQAVDADIPGRGRVGLTNLFAVAPGPTAGSAVIVVMAHRDASAGGRGANDDASGTAALIELARPYARSGGGPGRTLIPAHTLVFLSTDGGASGGIGAAAFADEPAYRDRIAAVVNLDTIGGPGKPRLVLAGDEPRSPAASLVQTAADRILAVTGEEPDRARALWQLVDLGFPFSLYEQAPFVARGTPAITITTAGDRPPDPLTDVSIPSPKRLEEVGRAAQSVLASLDEGLQLSSSSRPYVYFGPRIVAGWAVELVLIAMLLPFLAAAVDLFARLRRRRIPLAPALRSYRSRLAFWLFVGALFAVFGFFGAWPDGTPRPISPDSPPAQDWPIAALGAVAALSAVAWLVPRERLLPQRTPGEEDELAGYTAALLALGVLSLVVVALNPFSLLFVLPSLHAWLWLPHLRDRPAWMRLAVLAAGLAGLVLLVGSYAVRLDLGLDTLWYLATLVSVGYVEPLPVVVALAWTAATAQLAALAVRRYGPYPSASERPPRGPIRETVRHLVLAVRARRSRDEEDDVRALPG